MKIYIACPYTKGDTAMNVRASLFAQDAIESMGHMAYNPLLSHFQHLVLPHRDVDWWYEKDLKWLRECDALLRLPGESVGADREVEVARDLNIPIYHCVEEIPKVKR